MQRLSWEAEGLSAHRLVVTEQQQSPSAESGYFASALVRNGKGWMSQLRVDITEHLIQSVNYTASELYLSGAADLHCCQGYYAIICYFNEVLNEIVST